MEIALDDRIPTYSGGLGILAGDLAHSFADLGLPATFVTLLSRNGYVSQKLDATVGQLDSPQRWDWPRILHHSEVTVDIDVWDRPQKVGVWEHRIKGKTDVDVLFLDTDFPDNSQEVKEATDRLYGGDITHRLIQDMVLGIGGYRVLKALGKKVEMFHLNESHAAFAAIELLRDAGGIDEVHRKCVFTTHTPIAAGNDAFPLGMVQDLMRTYSWINWSDESTGGSVNLSKLAAKYSGVTNAVSLKHRNVSEKIVGHDRLTYVTNGVYHRRWIHPEIRKVLDKHVIGWDDSPNLLVGALGIPRDDLEAAHAKVKADLVAVVNASTGQSFSPDALTITMAKRITAYKRNGMILQDKEKLEHVAMTKGKIQIILAGKTHPKDNVAKSMLKDIINRASEFNNSGKGVKVAVLENYSIEMAKLLVAGSDVWLNNPVRPLEACGTSGMKAAMNGVLNLGVYDGWWLEGGVDGVNGWGIGRRTDWEDVSPSPQGEEEGVIYQRLEADVVPVFYGDRNKWLEMAKTSIATVGPAFNSYRMLEDYVTKVYDRASA
jgi:starch phosphorylase